MITTGELLAIKSRLLTAADAAYQIATSANPVRYEQSHYEVVYAALVLMKDDLTTVLAELDVLRGMAGSASPFMEEQKDGVPDTGGDVAALPDEVAGGGSEAERPQPKGSDGRVPKSRVPRKRTIRSKSRRNKGDDPAIPASVGQGHRESQVDRSEDA